MNKNSKTYKFVTQNQSVHLISREILWFFRGIPGIIRITNSSSYFPEYDRKKYFNRMFENLKWLLQHHECNEFYNLYGFDVIGKNVNQKSYQDYLHFLKELEKSNIISVGKENSQVSLLRDKYLFYKYMKCNGLPVPEVFAILRNGKLYDKFFNPIEKSSLKNKKNYFIKELDGECASYVKHLSDYNGLCEVWDKVKLMNCIFQESLVQNCELNKLNPNAINTLRIVTINNGDPYVLSAIIRVGTSLTNNVDNWAKGGLAIGVENTGYLKKYGLYKPKFGTKIDIHPDTKIQFSNFKIPYYDEALKLACDAHKFFYGVFAIGWDIAITEDGPSFIEGNDNWEISLMQACDKGLLDDWKIALESKEKS